jgi:UDP-N-acetylmuramate: L-alanyl-gamma-D-glutamyl-meso-diaminopimelate ligase
VESLIASALADLPRPCHIVIMSNGGFGGIHAKLVAELERIGS